MKTQKLYVLLFISFVILFGILIHCFIIGKHSGSIYDIYLEPSQQTHNRETHSTNLIPSSSSGHQYNRLPLREDDPINGFALFEIEHNLPKLESYTKSFFPVEKALRSGAKGMITLHVTDVDLNPITDVKINAICRKSNPYNDVWEYSATTDENGFSSLVVESRSEIDITLLKDGFYQSRYKYQFFKNGYQCVTHGRWIPWNPILELQLKPIHDPQPRAIRKATLIFPSRGEPYGFDCDAGDFVEPFGKGTKVDFNITFFSDITPEGLKQFRYTNAVHFASISKNSGFQVFPLDYYSNLPTIYEAPTNRYQPNLDFKYQIWEPSASCIQKINPLEGGQYIVFCSPDNNTTNPLCSMHYGKILPYQFAMQYDDQIDKMVLSFHYYYNPIPNDRNLEGSDDDTFFKW